MHDIGILFSSSSLSKKLVISIISVLLDTNVLRFSFLYNRHEADLNCVTVPLNKHRKSICNFVRSELFLINRNEADMNCVTVPLNKHRKSICNFVRSELFLINGHEAGLNYATLPHNKHKKSISYSVKSELFLIKRPMVIILKIYRI